MYERVCQWREWREQLDPAGQVLWQREFDLDAFTAVAIDVNDRPLAVGFEQALPEDGYRNLLIRRYSVDGDEEWTHTHDGPGGPDAVTDDARGVAYDGDQNAVVGGHVHVSPEHGLIDGWIGKYALP